MSTTASFPVVKAVELVLRGPLVASNSNFHIFNYRDKQIFRDLWQNGLDSHTPTVNGTALDWKNGDQQILILGNDPPDGIFETKLPGLQGINFRSHFTAVSWLAAWKVKFSPTKMEKEKGSVEGMTRIAVIDPHESRFAQGTAQALQAIFGALDPLGHTLVPGATVLSAPRLENIYGWLHDSCPTRDKRTAAKDAPHLRDLLKSTIWSELTSDREHHHALSNVLGALLLMAQVGPSGLLTQKFKLPMQDSLLSLVRACGVNARLCRNEVGDQDDKSPSWISESLNREIGGAVLLDDMSDLWTPFLAVALAFYGPSYSRFVTAPTGEFPAMLRGLPQRLQAVLARGPNAKLSAADLVPGDHSVADSFVLFLDLRLFASQGQNSEEPSFYNALAIFGLRLLDSERNLPWLDTEHAREDLRMDLERIRQGQIPMGRETLLARLIALLDPTLPIVIFSSTHRTELTDAFRNYGNILTNFRKPILTALQSNWTDMAAGLRTDFLSSMELASRILAIRGRLRILETMAYPSPHAMVFDEGKAYHVELFLDEATGELAPIGGLFAVFEGATIDEAQARSQQFDDVLVSEGIRYFHSYGIGPQAPTGLKAKGDECLDELARACNTDARPKYLGALRVRLKQTVVSSLPRSSTFDQFDKEWLGGLEAVIELFVGEWLGLAEPGRPTKTSIAIYVAGRSTPPTGLDDVGRARYRTGWETTSNLIQTFNRRDCWRVARAILDERKAVADLDRAVGVSLVYERTPTGTPKRASEWALRGRKVSIKADGSASEIKMKLRKIEPALSRWRPDYPTLLYAADACLKKWGNWSTFLVPYTADLHLNESLVQIANAGRSLDSGKVAESLLQFPMAITGDNRPIASLLASRLSHRVARISHTELRRAFDSVTGGTT